MEFTPITANALPVGMTVGVRTILSGPYRHSESAHHYYLCHCNHCQQDSHVLKGNFLKGATRCKHCIGRNTDGKKSQHGQSKTKLYRVWNTMCQRCTNPQVERYPRYGGRGIRLCDAWQQFIPFKDWALAHGYQDGLTIDRLDTDGDYTPENCRWTTPTEQANNRRTTRTLTAFGESKSLANWTRDPRCLVTSTTLNRRLQLGWAVEAALTEPLKEQHEYANKGKRVHYITAFGETKTMKQWFNDPRCTARTYMVLFHRLRRYPDSEQAITYTDG